MNQGGARERDCLRPIHTVILQVGTPVGEREFASHVGTCALRRIGAEAVGVFNWSVSHCSFYSTMHAGSDLKDSTSKKNKS